MQTRDFNIFIDCKAARAWVSPWFEEEIFLTAERAAHAIAEASAQANGALKAASKATAMAEAAAKAAVNAKLRAEKLNDTVVDMALHKCKRTYTST